MVAKPEVSITDDVQARRLVALFDGAKPPGARPRTVPPWRTNPDGSWAQQPVVLVEGEPAFVADTPEEYAVHIMELRARYQQGELLWGPFHATTGQFLDESERPKA